MSALPQDADVLVFEAFDSNGPNTWKEPEVSLNRDGTIHIEPQIGGDEKCPACDGCGKVADTQDREPWTAWRSLPLCSASAVVLGVVKPIDCPACGGSGKVAQKHTTVPTPTSRRSVTLADNDRRPIIEKPCCVVIGCENPAFFQEHGILLCTLHSNVLKISCHELRAYGDQF